MLCDIYNSVLVVYEVDLIIIIKVYDWMYSFHYNNGYLLGHFGDNKRDIGFICLDVLGYNCYRIPTYNRPCVSCKIDRTFITH